MTKYFAIATWRNEAETWQYVVLEDDMNPFDRLDALSEELCEWRFPKHWRNRTVGYTDWKIYACDVLGDGTLDEPRNITADVQVAA